MIDPTIGTAESNNEKKTPYIFLEGDITHIRTGTEADGSAIFEPVPKPERRTVFMYLSEAAFAFTADKLDALGWNGDFRNPELSDENKAGIWVECGHETYKNQPKERWNLPGGGGIEHTPVAADAIRKINAMYNARKKAAGGSAAGPKKSATPPSAEPAGAAMGKDGIPF